MITQVSLQPIISNMDPVFGTLSITTTIQIVDNGVELTRYSNISAFGPGDIERVKLFLGTDTGALIDYLSKIWTDEAIANYTTFIASQNHGL